MLRRSNNAAGDALAARETHRDKTCMDVVGSDLFCRCLAHGLCRQPRIGSVARDTTQAAENVGIDEPRNTEYVASPISSGLTAAGTSQSRF